MPATRVTSRAMQLSGRPDVGARDEVGAYVRWFMGASSWSFRREAS